MAERWSTVAAVLMLLAIGILSAAELAGLRGAAGKAVVVVAGAVLLGAVVAHVAAWRRFRARERAALPEIDQTDVIRSRLPLAGPFEPAAGWVAQSRRERRREWLDNLFWFVMLATALIQAPIGGKALFLGLSAIAWLGTLLSLERHKRLAHAALLVSLRRGHLRAREDGWVELVDATGDTWPLARNGWPVDLDALDGGAPCASA